MWNLDPSQLIRNRTAVETDDRYFRRQVGFITYLLMLWRQYSSSKRGKWKYQMKKTWFIALSPQQYTYSQKCSWLNLSNWGMNCLNIRHIFLILVPSSFHFFSYLNKILAGKHSKIAAVNTYLGVFSPN